MTDKTRAKVRKLGAMLVCDWKAQGATNEAILADTLKFCAEMGYSLALQIELQASVAQSLKETTGTPNVQNQED